MQTLSLSSILLSHIAPTLSSTYLQIQSSFDIVLLLDATFIQSLPTIACSPSIISILQDNDFAIESFLNLSTKSRNMYACYMSKLNSSRIEPEPRLTSYAPRNTSIQAGMLGQKSFGILERATAMLDSPCHLMFANFLTRVARSRCKTNSSSNAITS